VLRGKLGHPVRRDGSWPNGLPGRIRLGVPVDRGAGSVDQPPQSGATGRLQESLGQQDVSFEIDRELRPPGSAYAGLAGQVIDDVSADKKRIQGNCQQIAPPERESAAAEQWTEVVPFARGIVVRGQRVDADYLVPAGQQVFTQVGTDEAGCSGHDGVHEGRPPSGESHTADTTYQNVRNR